MLNESQFLPLRERFRRGLAVFFTSLKFAWNNKKLLIFPLLAATLTIFAIGLYGLFLSLLFATAVLILTFVTCTTVAAVMLCMVFGSIAAQAATIFTILAGSALRWEPS